MLSFDEYQQAVNGKAAKAAEALTSDRRTITLRAAVDAEKLLGDEKWDRYLELLRSQ